MEKADGYALIVELILGRNYDYNTKYNNSSAEYMQGEYKELQIQDFIIVQVRYN